MSHTRKLFESQAKGGQKFAKGFRVLGWSCLSIAVIIILVPLLFGLGPLGIYVAGPFLLMAGMFIFVGKRMSKQMDLYKGAAAEVADILEKQLKD
ncbi:hypothetical protein D781_2194 [Serratia sp. FGI94]|uniref:hypothetical protein n=1 Tax=Serratia sp. FGI94 TaxID=671990 RepID=UPI0002A70B52|nr:hypothetical protein [Serratia sp. FGI94]AGB82465.1 hypothetical protein D781_2194 [Serratia sp. FGI94]